MDPIAQFIILAAFLLLLGVLGEVVFAYTGIPDVVWLVLAGFVAGPVLHIVSPALLRPAIPYFGAVALIVILAGGGYRFRFADIKGNATRGLLLAASGFLFSILGVCVLGLISTRLGWIQPHSPWNWVLVGAIVGGTSSLVIMPTVASDKVDRGVARLLEFESSATDIACIVIVMVVIDVVTRDKVDFSRPLLALSREVGFGFGLGALFGLALLPLVMRLSRSTHGYTIFLAVVFVLYGIEQQIGGNGAMAVMTCSMILGNGKTIVGWLKPEVANRKLEAAATTRAIHGQIAFIIKAFFFTLIGLMFPMSPRLIALGAALAVVLLLFRIPAVHLALAGSPFDRRQRGLVTFAMPRGIATGVLSAVPLQMGVAGMENLAPVIFAFIVFSILIFAGGFAVMLRKKGTPLEGNVSAGPP